MNTPSEKIRGNPLTLGIIDQRGDRKLGLKKYDEVATLDLQKVIKVLGKRMRDDGVRIFLCIITLKEQIFYLDQERQR